MTTLRQIKIKIDNLSESENGAKYTLTGNAAGDVFTSLRNFVESTKQHYSSAILEVEGHSTVDMFEDDFPIEIESIDKSGFSLELDKKRENNFPILSINCFMDYYKESACRGITFLGFINNAFNNPILVDYNVQLLKYGKGLDEINKIDIFSKAVNFAAKESIKVVPSHVRFIYSTDSTDESFLRVMVFYKSLLNAYSLMFLASSVELETGKVVLKIDGYKEVECEISIDEIENKFDKMGVYNEIIKWIFNESVNGDLQMQDSKQLYLERLGIVRNVFSLEIKPHLEDEKGLYKITDTLISKCKSSYNIFLKSKTKEYFDLRMKLEEHVEKLVRNLSEESTAFVNSFRNNMYIFISLVFSTLLLTYSRNISNDGFGDFIGREDVGFVIMSYAILNIALLIVSSYRLYASNKAIINDKDNFKLRYNKLLDKGDTEDIVESAFTVRMKHNRCFYWIITIFWLLFCFVLYLNQPIYNLFKTG